MSKGYHDVFITTTAHQATPPITDIGNISGVKFV